MTFPLGWPVGRRIRDYIDVPYSQEALDRDVHYTEYNGTMLRGVECIDGGKGELPFVPQPPHPNQILWEKKIHIDPEQTYLYDAASEIVFAIHTSPKYAQSVDLPNILVTGTCVELHYRILNEDGLVALSKGYVKAQL